MSTGVQGGRPLGRFRLLGFPVHIDLTFVLFVGFLGFAQGLTLGELVVWVLVALVSVLLHELGHAVLARRVGASPAITLMAMGGVTTYTPPRQLSRVESLGISLAGPAVGLLLGGALLLLRPDEDPPGLVGFALRAAIFTTLGWSLFNLLPIVPLDGGQALRELLPGDPVARAKRAAVVSIVLAIVLAVVAVQNHWIGTFGLVLAAFLVLSNVIQLRGLSAAAGRGQEAGSGDGAGQGTEVLRLLWEGRPAQARAALERRAQLEDPSDADGDLALHGAVLATTGQREQGFALLYQEWSRRGGDQHVTGLIALSHLLLGEWQDIARLLTGPSAALVPVPILVRAIGAARASGDEDSARRIEDAGRRAGLLPAPGG
jgi:stage IV sporulation protein FB